MQRTTRRLIKTVLALTCSTAVAVTTTAQARPTHADHSSSTTTISKCKIAITATPWDVGAHAGSKYTVAGQGMSCNSSG